MMSSQSHFTTGNEEACILSQEELRVMEPSLSHKALGAVYCPYEAVVEPWLVAMGYAESARLNGVHMQTGQ
jgi:glycerol-3-phosphate dehydrogenase